MSSSALPIGTVHITKDKHFDPNTTKNNLFVGVWEKIDEYDIYPVATSEGSSHISMSEADIIGSNNQSISTDWKHNHLENPHSHENYNRTSNFSGTGSQYGGRMGTAGDNSGTITATAPTTATNQNAGSQDSATKIINNRPGSFKTTMWIRIS